MNDKMTGIEFPQLMDWIFSEKGSIFGVRKKFIANANKTIPLFKEKLELPIGPAAGPHTQLAQNIIAAYISGARFFELKTVQILDGEDLPVSKPCIYAGDEGYNVEWSTELTVPLAFCEYVKAWFALKLISREFGLGNENGFIFNMSVGYDYNGIKSKKIDTFIEGLKDASETRIWQECTDWAYDNLDKFDKIDERYIEEISPNICSSITLSTLHGCPPKEIERIASYLLTEKKLNTFIKCNPTLLGYEFSRKTLDNLGFSYLVFDEHHFKNDLQFADAVPMIARLLTLAQENFKTFGVKLTNTFPVKIASNELPGEEMYMSGRSLFPLAIALCAKLSKEFGGRLPLSFSGGADVFNIKELFSLGIYPITLATTLLKPGGYERFYQIAGLFANADYSDIKIKPTELEIFARKCLCDMRYKKPIKPLPKRKINAHVPLLSCTLAPCQNTCPIEQDIPKYIALAGEGKYYEALEVIMQKNPLPFITGTICPHTCRNTCRRNFYEDSVHIRSVKLLCANGGHEYMLKKIVPAQSNGIKAAVIGGGTTGLASAYFLAKMGFSVTVFEKRDTIGGIVSNVIPHFRISPETIAKDIEIIEKTGVEFRLNSNVSDFEELKAQGYKYIIAATGAWKQGEIHIEGIKTIDVIHFLINFNRIEQKLDLGENIGIIGGGNTAMDAARAAKRLQNAKNVYIIYRRDIANMPADEEELLLAMAEGVEFLPLVSPAYYKDGVLYLNKMVLGEKDSSGRRSPVITDEITEVKLDSVIAAVGEKVDIEYFAANGIKYDADMKNEQIYSPKENIFIAGDAKRGGATVVEGIADAINIAREIAKTEDISLKTQTALSCNYNLCVQKSGVLNDFTSAKEESNRCLSCDCVCEVCTQVCPNRANIAIKTSYGIQILHVDKMCNSCGNCTVFCPYDSSPYLDKFTLFHTANEFETSKSNGFLYLDANLKIRLNDEIYEGNLADFKSNEQISALILCVLNDYSYLL